MNEYNTKEFKELQKAWYDRLKKDGFEDIEDSFGLLRNQNQRTISWENRDEIRDFYLKVGRYLFKTKGIPRIHRNILKKWAEGEYQVDIAKKSKASLRTVKYVVEKYKKIIINWSEDEQDFGEVE